MKMDLSGISSLPARWKRIIQMTRIFFLITFLEGIGALVWIMNKPSEPENRLLLQYSFERWVLIASNLLFLFLIVFILGVLNARLKCIERWLELSRLAQFSNIVLGICTFLVGVTIFLFAWVCNFDLFQPYIATVLPLLILCLVTVIQIWIALILILYRSVASIWNSTFSFYKDTQIHSNAHNKSLFTIMIILSILYVLVQVETYLDIQEAIPMGDTTSYLEGASLELSNPDFFSERRPWGILLIFKLLGKSFISIDIAQSSISTFAWLMFAWIFCRSLNTEWGKLAGFSIILGFSLTPIVQVWNHTILSESFNISLTILILTTLLLMLQEWKWYLLFILVLLIVIWMSVHEVNLYIGLLTATVFLATGIFRKQFRIYWLVSICIGMIFLINYQLSSAYGLPRWALPLAEVITQRILPNSEYLEYFAANGMPISPELMALSGRWAHSDNYAIINSIKLRKFSNWLFNDGKMVYTKFLLSHPIYFIKTPLENLRILLAADFLGVIPIPKYTSVLPKMINELLYPISWFWTYLCSILILVIFIAFKGFKNDQRVFWMVLLLLITSIPYLYLAWHGDALNVARHAIMANIQFHIAIWMLLVFCLNENISLWQLKNIE